MKGGFNVEVVVTKHALERFKNRCNTNACEKTIINLLRSKRFIEPGKKGSEIIESGGFVWVIYKTRKQIFVKTILSSLKEYEVKRPHKLHDYNEVEYYKWEKSHNKKRLVI